VALLVVTACGFDSDAEGMSLTATLGEVPGTTSGSGDATGSIDSDTTTTTTEADASDDGATTESSVCGTGWWNDAWSRRTRMRFRGGVQGVDYDGATTDLVDMPVLVVLTPNRIDQDAVAPGGSDLRFVDVNGTVVLPHEIERWSPGGTSFVWVRLPTVPYLDDTYSFWVYYGNPNAPSNESAEEVWSSGYRGVWHLGEPDGPLHNSAENLAHGDPGNTAHEASGKIAAARRFGGHEAGDQHIPLGPDSAAYFDGWSSFTLSLWVRPDYPDDETWEQDHPGRLLHKGAPMSNGVAIRQENASLPAGEGRGRIRFQFQPDDQGVSPSVVLRRQQWSWIAYTFDGEVVRAFLDGIEVGSDLVSGHALVGGTNTIHFGHTSEALLGALDEIRFADVARSWVWIEAQHRSMTDELLAYSNPESCP
jgi:hypothetical protein